jgi:small-conductance mechanosensitive channel
MPFIKKLIFLPILFLLSGLCLAQNQDSTSINHPDTIKKPVIFFDEALFFIGTKLGPFQPEERATIFSNKLKSLLDSANFDTTLLRTSKDDLAIEILHGEIILGSVTEADAAYFNLDKNNLAENYINAIKASFKRNYNDRSTIENLIRTGLLLLVIIVVFLLVRFINIGFNKSIDFILSKWNIYFKGIRIKNFELLSAEREEKLLKIIMRILKIFLIILLLSLTLPMMFKIFPATENLADTLLGYITTPIKGIFSSFFGYMPELFTILIVIVITFYVGEFINFISGEVERGNLNIPGFYPDWAKPTFNLVKIIVYAFSFIVIFPYLPGSDSPAFQGVSVFLGLLISLGSSSAISNIIAGLVIIYMRAFKIGDRVKIGDTTGDVIEKTMLVTRLRTIKNEEVTIPNSAILNGNTVNYSVESNGAGLILHSTVTIGYDVPWRQVHELLISAALKVNAVLKEPKPFVLQTSLDDFYVSYQINAYTDDSKKAAKSYSDLHSNIQDAFSEADVEIMSPHYRANRGGDQLTIPPKYIPDETKPIEEPIIKNEAPEKDSNDPGDVSEDSTYN